MDQFFTRLVLSNHTPDRVGRHVLFWTVCWLFQGFLYGFFYWNGQPALLFRISFVESLFFLPQHIMLSYGIMYYVLPNYFFKDRYWGGILWVMGLILLSALLSPLVNELVISPYRNWIGFPRKGNTVFYSFMGGLRGSMTISGFAVAIKLMKIWYLKKIEHEQLEKEKLKAELDLLTGQLHPHFMFNTLNNIYSLSLTDSKQTPEAILKLSHLMHYMIKECRQPYISIGKEIDMIQSYLALEKARFGERLEITLNVSGDLSDHHIPPLMLLPLIENSVKHGVNQMPEQAWISMDVVVRNGEFICKIINGVGDNQNASRQSPGIGLQNIKKRLALLYPERHELRITHTDDVFIVTLFLALKQIQPEVTPAHEYALSYSG